MENQNNYHNFERNALVLYAKPHLWRSIWQLSSTLIFYFILWYLMYLSLGVSYLITLAYSILATGMIIRLFIIFHDCGHGSYFNSRKLNDIVGMILSLALFIPYYYWKTEHLKHHGSVCNLDYRGRGDIWTLSRHDYAQASGWYRFRYQLARNPLGLFFETHIFIRNRFAPKGTTFKQRQSIYFTNLGMMLIIFFMSVAVGWKNYLLIQLPIFFFGAGIGSWLFYVQHQFKGARWVRTDQWDHRAAVFEGTSYYDLPIILHWFTGNIGFHHVHHLAPKVPNYYLRRCHRNIPALQSVPTLTLGSSLKMLKNNIYDEDMHEFVSFSSLRRIGR